MLYKKEKKVMYKLADGSCSTDYEVGDMFEVVKRGNFKVGDIIYLSEDDSSACPNFKLLGRAQSQYSYWVFLKPHKKVNNKMKDTQDKIKVMQAYVDGEEIEFSNNTWPNSWCGISTNIKWSWAKVNYRIKPKVKEMTVSEIEKQLGHSIKVVK
jgi:hypothetical protein